MNPVTTSVDVKKDTPVNLVAISMNALTKHTIVLTIKLARTPLEAMTASVTKDFFEVQAMSVPISMNVQLKVIIVHRNRPA